MVQFFLTMIFTDVPASLGWDPTIQVVRDLSGNPDASVQYDYTVEDADGTQTVYRTLSLIAESSPENSEKGLRVWRAMEVRDGAPYGDIVVLKDIWRLSDLPQEGSNMRGAIEPATGRDMSDEAKEALRRAVLPVLHHGDVVIHHDANGSNASAELPVDEAGKHLGDFERSRPELPGNWRTKTGEETERRTHYRMVMPLYTPLDKIQWEHHKVYLALAEVCEGTDSILPYVAQSLKQ